MPVKPIPDGYHAVTPYLVARGADKTVEFLKKAFGAELSFEPMTRPDGKIMHADLKIGDSHVMISEATEQHPAMPCMVHLYVPNVDAVYQRAWRRAAARRWNRRTSSTATAPAA
jgi:PhnB protein